MDEKKGEELENELQLIYIFKAISELPHIFATLIKTVQHPYTSLSQYACDLCLKIFLVTLVLISLYPLLMFVNFVSYSRMLEEEGSSERLEEEGCSVWHQQTQHKFT